MHSVNDTAFAGNVTDYGIVVASYSGDQLQSRSL
jgi:hypothetical protein